MADSDIHRLIEQVPANMRTRVRNAIANLWIESFEELREIDPIVFLRLKNSGDRVVDELLHLGVWPDVPSVRVARTRWTKAQQEALWVAAWARCEQRDREYRDGRRQLSC